MHRESLQLSNKKPKQADSHEGKAFHRHFAKEDIQISIGKMFNIIDH